MSDDKPYSYAFVHSLGMKTARKQAEKVDVWHEYVGYCITHWQQ
ncbi:MULTISPECIES: hypothetical protein [unclassified Nostoc]|nr:hypothetical protein [Nostoc sp. DedQUE03]MDZ7973552.1 hypothetical protein [Nostoc sp. DedQUE03]MDZ8049421.1 hypothetical protein [Nostoc sp. DedQUE02]